MRVVTALTLVVSVVSLVLIAWLLLSEPWEAEPATISLPPPQPTLTRCENLTQQIANALNDTSARILYAQAQSIGCEHFP